MAKNFLKDKIAVLTGASAGVGRATARLLALHGVKLALLSRNAERLERTRDEVESAGGQALIIPTDVSSHDQVFSAGKKIVAEYGTIDIWINNSMASVFGRVQDIAPEEYRKVTETTYLGYVYGTLFALKHMLAKDQGTIIQVGSALTYRSIPLQAPYCAAKHAIAGFTDSLRAELLHDKKKIDVTMVHLPGINTPQFNWVKLKGLDRFPRPVPPVFQPEVAAQAILRAVEKPGRRERLISFTTKKVIWAQRLWPRFAEWQAARNAFEAQLTDRPVSDRRQDNLWDSPDGDYGAHGSFDDEAKPAKRSPR